MLSHSLLQLGTLSFGRGWWSAPAKPSCLSFIRTRNAPTMLTTRAQLLFLSLRQLNIFRPGAEFPLMRSDRLMYWSLCENLSPVIFLLNRALKNDSSAIATSAASSKFDGLTAPELQAIRAYAESLRTLVKSAAGKVTNVGSSETFAEPPAATTQSGIVCGESLN